MDRYRGIIMVFSFNVLKFISAPTNLAVQDWNEPEQASQLFVASSCVVGVFFCILLVGVFDATAGRYSIFLLQSLRNQ